MEVIHLDPRLKVPKKGYFRGSKTRAFHTERWRRPDRGSDGTSDGRNAAPGGRGGGDAGGGGAQPTFGTAHARTTKAAARRKAALEEKARKLRARFEDLGSEVPAGFGLLSDEEESSSGDDDDSGGDEEHGGPDHGSRAAAVESGSDFVRRELYGSHDHVHIHHHVESKT